MRHMKTISCGISEESFDKNTNYEIELMAKSNENLYTGIKNKNTKCPVNAHCHRHCKRNPRIDNALCCYPHEKVEIRDFKILKSKG